MTALEWLELQHAENLRMLRLLEETEPGAVRRMTFRRLQRSLTAQMVIEEELFYPALGEHGGALYEEHAKARVALGRCFRALIDDGLFRVRAMALELLVKKHLTHERSVLSPRAQRALAPSALVELGAKMRERFEQTRHRSNASAKIQLSDVPGWRPLLN